MVEDPVPETDILDRDYDERRRILIVEPRVVSALRAAHELGGPPDKKFFKNLPGGSDEKLKKQIKGILELQEERQLLPPSAAQADRAGQLESPEEAGKPDG